MSRLDVVIFGATGFTGKHVAFECARLAKKNPGFTWAVAGRSQSKLNAVLDEASKRTGEDLSTIPVIVADVSDEDSLHAMCRRAKVLVDCCGPYWLYGEPVVAASVQCGAHYLDVSGEPQFIEAMQLKYDAAARDAGVYIISACGFDSVPNDMGVIFLEQNFKGTLNSVESYLSGSLAPEYREAAKRNGVINYGTWASIVYWLAHQNELKPIRKQLFPEPLPTLKPKINKMRPLHRRDGVWCVPFLGPDGSIVDRTQRHLYATGERPVQFGAYLTLPGWWAVPFMMLSSILLACLASFSLGRRLLLKYPRLFSMGYVSQDLVEQRVMDNTNFTFTLHGSGWSEGTDLGLPPNKTVTVKVSGTNPGYGATVVALTQSALTILKEKDKMPKNGGVMTTGYAFRNSTLIKRLHENNLKFEIVNKLIA